jgi:hypothetical protein
MAAVALTASQINAITKLFATRFRNAAASGSIFYCFTGALNQTQV